VRALAAALVVCAVGVAAPWLAPYDPDEIVDVLGTRDLPPGSVVTVFTRDDGSRLAASSAGSAGGSLIVTRGGRREEIPLERLASREGETRRFLLGTDSLGRDLLSRLLHASRLSIGVGTLAVLLGLAIGVTAGGAGGFLGGIVDAALMRLVDALHAVPRLFLFLLCAALFDPSALLVAVVLGASGWPGIARITRAHVLSLRESGFTASARALGAGRGRILVRHILPHCAAPVAIATVLLAADTILAESSLSFIGLGVQPPAASLGCLIASARAGVAATWWAVVFPGLVLVALVLLLHATARPNTLKIKDLA
jgi:ABC-type dipeptide/oligopeptide/nickel transport system permease subunit